jgi:glutathione S-transferase
MRLYQHPISSNARRVLMTAVHIGAPVEFVEINLMSEADRRLLGELNPNNKIPVLQDGDLLLWESHAIMQYLCDRQGGHPLYPAEVAARADVNRWLFWSAQHWSPAISVFTWENVWKKVVTGQAADERELERGREEFEACAAVLDKHLAGREWVAGHALTLADLALAAPLMYIGKAKLPVSGYRNLENWFARVQKLPCWAETATNF